MVAAPVIEGQNWTDPEIHRRRWWILAVLCLSLLIVGIDGTIVNVALPSFVRELGATTSQLQWISDAYTLAFASLLLTAGSLGDRFGRRGTLIVGLVDLRARFAGLGPGRIGRTADRHARGAGRRRRLHHAVDAVDPHQRLRRRRARSRHRHLGRRVGPGGGHRPRHRRMAARPLLVGRHLHGEPARSWWSPSSRPCCIVPDVEGSVRRAHRPRWAPCCRSRCWSPSCSPSSKDRATDGRSPLILSVLRRRRGAARRVRAVGAARRAPHARRVVLREPSVLRGVDRRDARVLRHVRLDVLPDPVHAVRAWATRRCRPECASSPSPSC